MHRIICRFKIYSVQCANHPIEEDPTTSLPERVIELLCIRNAFRVFWMMVRCLSSVAHEWSWSKYLLALDSVVKLEPEWAIDSLHRYPHLLPRNREFLRLSFRWGCKRVPWDHSLGHLYWALRSCWSTCRSLHTRPLGHLWRSGCRWNKWIRYQLDQNYGWHTQMAIDRSRGKTDEGWGLQILQVKNVIAPCHLPLDCWIHHNRCFRTGNCQWPIRFCTCFR